MKVGKAEQQIFIVVEKVAMILNNIDCSIDSRRERWATV